MKSDPIIEEVREAGRILAEKANNDVGQFFANLRDAEKNYDQRRLVKPKAASASSKRAME